MPLVFSLLTFSFIFSIMKKDMMSKNLIRKKHLREKFLNLLKSNPSAKEIARGIALGVFIGIIPFYGLHTIIAIILTMLIPRTNRIAVLLGTNVSMPIALPLITWSGYNIGRIIVRGNYPILRWAELRNLGYQDIPNLYEPLFLGSVFLGIVCSIIFYILVYMTVKK